MFQHVSTILLVVQDFTSIHRTLIISSGPAGSHGSRKVKSMVHEKPRVLALRYSNNNIKQPGPKRAGIIKCRAPRLKLLIWAASVRRGIATASEFPSYCNDALVRFVAAAWLLGDPNESVFIIR